MPSTRLLRHVVLIQFKAAVTPEQLADAGKAFLALPAQIEAIHSLEWGQGLHTPNPYSHCLLVTFHDQDGLQAYEDHPAHRAVVADYGPLIERLVALNYWAEMV